MQPDMGQRGALTSVNRETKDTGAVSAMGEPPEWDAASHPTQSHTTQFNNNNASVPTPILGTKPTNRMLCYIKIPR